MLWPLVCYLVSSLPTTKWIVKRRLNFYSASEVFRKVGVTKGTYVGAIDIAKGYLAISLVSSLGGGINLHLASGLSAVAGQVFPIFNRFKGGGGLLTSFGALFYINPSLATIAAVIVVSFVVLKQAGIGVFLAWLVTHLLAVQIGDANYSLFATGHAILVAIAYVIRYVSTR